MQPHARVVGDSPSGLRHIHAPFGSRCGSTHRHLALRGELCDHRASREGIVYYMERSDGLIKIGTTTNYTRRRGELLTKYGALSLVAWEFGDGKLETVRHRQFAALRAYPPQTGHEWFKPGEPLIDWILNILALTA